MSGGKQVMRNSGAARRRGSLELLRQKMRVMSSARNCTEQPDQNAEKCGNPLVIWCRFGAVTNSQAVTGALSSASRHRNIEHKLKELRGAPRCRSESLGVGCKSFNPLVDDSIPSRPILQERVDEMDAAPLLSEEERYGGQAQDQGGPPGARTASVCQSGGV